MALFVTLTLMLIVTVLQIVCRIWFRALVWSEELTCFMLVFATFLGTAIAFKRGANIAVTFLLDKLPNHFKKAMLLVIQLLGIAFFSITTWYGAVLCFQERMQTASSLPISMGLVYSVFPLTGVITILHLAGHIEDLLRYGIPDKKGS